MSEEIQNATTAVEQGQPAAERSEMQQYRQEREAEREADIRRGRAPDELPTGERGSQKMLQRIDTLTRNWRETQRDRDELKRQLDEALARNAQPATQPQRGTQPQPGTEAKPGEKPAGQEKPGTEQPKPVEEQQRELREHWQHSVQNFQTEFSRREDLKELQASASKVQLCFGAQNAIPLVPNGVEVAAHILRNPQIAERINNRVHAMAEAAYHLTGGDMRAVNAAAVRAASEEIGNLSHFLQWGGRYGNASYAARIERPVSSAPTPITPVGGGAGFAPSSEEETDPDKMSITQYRAQRERSRNPRRG